MNEAAIADHGIIGDLQTAALVSTDGSVDWFCCPRFDSPSVFGALLDHERGGHFWVRPVDEPYRTRQMYLPDSAVLITVSSPTPRSARWSTSCRSQAKRPPTRTGWFGWCAVSGVG